MSSMANDSCTGLVDEMIKVTIPIIKNILNVMYAALTIVSLDNVYQLVWYGKYSVPPLMSKVAKDQPLGCTYGELEGLQKASPV
jgi:hypothetical protein